MRIYLASGNPHKAEEFQRLAGHGRIEVISAKEVGGMPAVIEDAGTFEGNARKKALALAAHVPQGSWTLADDSGLCVDALQGAPGVESAYYAGPMGDSAANLAKLVSVMASVPSGQRKACFRCVLWLIDPLGLETSYQGRIGGHLLERPLGGHGFGYDPLFVPEGYSVSFAELDLEAKNRISHRARAWKELARTIRDTKTR